MELKGKSLKLEIYIPHQLGISPLSIMDIATYRLILILLYQHLFWQQQFMAGSPFLLAAPFCWQHLLARSKFFQSPLLSGSLFWLAATFTKPLAKLKEAVQFKIGLGHWSHQGKFSATPILAASSGREGKS